MRDAFATPTPDAHLRRTTNMAQGIYKAPRRAISGVPSQAAGDGARQIKFNTKGSHLGENPPLDSTRMEVPLPDGAPCPGQSPEVAAQAVGGLRSAQRVLDKSTAD